MSLSSDDLLKYEILNNTSRNFSDIELRIFPGSSNEDQKLFQSGGLTFGKDGVKYGSCDAVWLIPNKSFLDTYNNKLINELPVLALEGTDAISRGSTGNAQYQRFHHCLGALKNGIISVYYLRKGDSKVQPDLYGMAYFASLKENGYYLILQDLKEVDEILLLIQNFGLDSTELKNHLDTILDEMYTIFLESFNKKYKGSWLKFGDRRSTIVFDDFVIKYAGRSKRSFTDSSQRSGHIALGEMFLTKYFFYDKKMIYLFPKMNDQELLEVDSMKKFDKEWFLLRNEENVIIKTLDSITNLPKNVIEEMREISSKPIKGETKTIYDRNLKIIVDQLKTGVSSII